MKEHYDVVIIGAGPAGLLAAKALAESGFSVAVIERKSDPAVVSRTCGQSLLPPNEYFFGSLFHYNATDKRFCFTPAGLSFPYTGPVRELYGWHMHSPGMHRLQFVPAEGAPAAPIALAYDKEAMLSCLLDDISCDHVEVISGKEFSGLQPAGACVQITAGDISCTSSYVVAADGANSRVAEHLGYNANRRLIARLYVKSCFISGFRTPHPDSIVTAVMFIDSKPVYMFLLPRPDGDQWNFLILTLEQSIDLEKAYQSIISHPNYAGWFGGVEKHRDFCAVEDIYSPVVKPFKNNVLLVGDAGACQELECLGAMLSGWQGGCAIAAALREHQLGVAPEAVSRYEDWWLNTYIKQYDYQDYLSIFGIAYMFESPENIDYVFSMMPEPFAPTFNPYRAVRLLGERLQSVIPRIMQQRPDVLAAVAPKLMMFPSDIMAQTLER